MDIHERIKEERKKLNLNQTDMAALSGASKHSQIDWEKGKSSPNAQALSAWAAAGADVQYILTGVRSGAALAADEADLLADYRSMDVTGKKAMKALCKVYSRRQASMPDTTVTPGSAVVQQADTNAGVMVGIGNVVGNTTIHGIGADNGKPKRKGKN